MANAKANAKAKVKAKTKALIGDIRYLIHKVYFEKAMGILIFAI